MDVTSRFSSPTVTLQNHRPSFYPYPHPSRTPSYDVPSGCPWDPSLLRRHTPKTRNTTLLRIVLSSRRGHNFLRVVK